MTVFVHEENVNINYFGDLKFNKNDFAENYTKVGNKKSFALTCWLKAKSHRSCSVAAKPLYITYQDYGWGSGLPLNYLEKNY